MNEEYYLIKEAAAKIGVESHVLRYWEDELKMDIHRNEKGHRYYTEKDIEVLSKVRDLKKRGLQLKAIRNYLEMRRKQIAEGEDKNSTDALHIVAEEKTVSGSVEKEKDILAEEAPAAIVPVKQNVLTNEQKMEQFQQIMSRILSNAIQENNELIGKTAGEHAANAVVTQISGMTKEQEARAEERYKKLDQTLREIQKARQEAAAANMRPVDRRKQKRMKRRETVVTTPSQPGQATTQDTDKNSEEI